jgi:DNA-binding NarL/FixJ family response regulator
MDLMMPRIDGFEAAKRVKRSRPTVKVLAVTSLSADKAICHKMYRSGVDTFLSKCDIMTALAPMIRSLHKAA